MRKKNAAKAKKSVPPNKRPINQPSIELHPEGRGFIILAFALLIFISLLSFAYSPGNNNSLGVVGHAIGKWFHALFGLSSYVVCLFLGWIGWRLLFSKSINYLSLKIIFIGILVISLSILLSLIEDQNPLLNNALGSFFYPSLWESRLRYHLGGAPFFYFYRDLPGYNLYRIFNGVGVAILFSGTFFISLMFLAKIHPRTILEFLMKMAQGIKAFFMLPQQAPTKVAAINGSAVPEDTTRFVKLRNSQTPLPLSKIEKNAEPEEMLAINPEKDLKIRPSVSRKNQDNLMPAFPFDLPGNKAKEPKPKKTEPTSTRDPIQESLQQTKTALSKREKALEAQSIYNGDFTNYKIPDTNLLTPAKKVDQTSLKRDLRRQAEVLEETLCSFGIEAKVGQINCGPTINSFEVHPAIGVKVQKIKALESDIALNMEAKSIRIIAPIPGKAAVGIEIPNPQPQEVAFKDMLLAYQQSGRKFHIPILLGKSVSGDYVMSDLAKMPHCIIAGATGSGKSVCINTIVMSILLNAKPDEIKLIMVDPKKVELTAYNNLPHMLAPVITEPQGACAALMWLVKEMETRYDILKLVGVRNIEAFNSRKIDEQAEQLLQIEIPKKMQYIVCIIDELADLMMVASNDIETPIARIAQMARAVGIHLILATQRPSREVITGLIKANFPTRIAFKVASRINSQIILDETGAETLLGNGDMLFLPPGSSHLLRAQGAYVRDEDINAIVKFICDQAPANYVIQSFDTLAGLTELDTDLTIEPPKDSLYHEALDVVLNTGNASTTFLQRKLKVGYARAASLIDELEKKGVIGPAEGSKPRKILISRPNDTEAVEELMELDEQHEDINL